MPVKEYSIKEHIDMCYKMYQDDRWTKHQDQLKPKYNNEEFSNIVITKHAIQRLKERAEISNLSDKTDEQIKEWIKERLVHSMIEKVVPIKKFQVQQILNHNFEHAQYLRDANGMIYVIVDGVLKTVHKNEAKRYTKLS